MYNMHLFYMYLAFGLLSISICDVFALYFFLLAQTQNTLFYYQSASNVKTLTLIDALVTHIF